MSADPIIYCLERLTDYRQFERLASDLMAGTDYPSIEPLGGTADGGRDALYTHRGMQRNTVFAYSVRRDWRVKLRKDCERLAETGFSADTVVFVTTQPIDTRQKTHMREKIMQRFGWSVEYCDIERIRVLLIGPLRFLVSKHPAIFVPPWFERRGGELVTQEQHDLILIDHEPADHAFASWLFRRLSAAGYSVWCHGLAPLAGENADISIRTLIRQRAARYLPVLSKSSPNPDFRSRISIASAESNRTVPCWISDLSDQDFDSQLKAIVPVRFDLSWKTGLESLGRQLDDGGVIRRLGRDLGGRIALGTYQTEPLLTPKPEQVYANVFPVTVPRAILAYELDHKDIVLNRRTEREWAHVRRGRYLFSFASAPGSVPVTGNKPDHYAWRHFRDYYGMESVYLVKALVRRSLFVACYQAGFRWCNERHTFFLDEKSQQRHGYQHVDGVYTHVSFTGERAWGASHNRTKYRYQLGPIFRVAFDDEGAVWVTVRLYIRITDRCGVPLGVATIPSRRKRVTKNWWNRQWLQRTLGMMQFIAGKADINNHISIGRGKQTVKVSVTPLSWECPISIDVEALDRVGSLQAELAAARDFDDDGDSHTAEYSDA